MRQKILKMLKRQFNDYETCSRKRIRLTTNRGLGDLICLPEDLLTYLR